MTDEKPLHVAVAEALGWTNLYDAMPARGTWYGEPPWLLPTFEGDVPPRQTLQKVTRYDTDWSASGPLIEKYGVLVGPERDGQWDAASGDVATSIGYETPLMAVCALILKLKEAGKL